MVYKLQKGGRLDVKYRQLTGMRMFIAAEDDSKEK